MPAEITMNPIQRGDTLPLVYHFGPETDRIDMRGSTLVLTFKVSVFEVDSAAALTKEVTLPLDTPDADKGTFSFRLESSETKMLQTGLTYHYGVRIKSPDEPEHFEQTMFHGPVEVRDV